MALNETISSFISQGFQELTNAQISFGFKIMVIFGFIFLFNTLLFLFNTLLKLGMSLFDMMIYVIAFIKWVIYKILKKDV